MDKFISYERASGGASRIITFQPLPDGRVVVADIVECNDEDLLWQAQYELHPDIDCLRVDGEVVQCDCLTLREAALAAGHQA